MCRFVVSWCFFCFGSKTGEIVDLRRSFCHSGLRPVALEGRRGRELFSPPEQGSNRCGAETAVLGRWKILEPCEIPLLDSGELHDVIIFAQLWSTFSKVFNLVSIFILSDGLMKLSDGLPNQVFS